MLRLVLVAIFSIAFHYALVAAYPSFLLDGDLASHSSNVLKKRDAIPPLPGTAFTENDGREAAEAATPVWLWAKIFRMAPCYPESAIKIGSQPIVKNPGTGPKKGPAGPDPSDDCTPPGGYHDAYGLRTLRVEASKQDTILTFIDRYTKSRPFPVYFSTRWCEKHKQWRVTYSVYYVHDGAGSQGHKHDWESVTVCWKDMQDNLWQRDALILSQHSGYETRGWGEVQTVNGESDVRLEHDRYKRHPKVFVGFYKHANFFEKDDSLQVYNALAQNKEYRSDDWWYMTQPGDLHPGSHIGEWNAPNHSWNYGDASSSPPNINGGENGAKDICDF